MIRKQNQALSYILVFALLFNLLLPFPLARAEADSLISIRIADEQAEYSLEETITFEVNYNLETLERTPGGETGEQPGEPGEQPDEPGVDPGETDEPGEDSGETGEPGTPGEGESGEPGEPETGETGQPGETDETVIDETDQSEEPVQPEEELIVETGEAVPAEEVSGENGQGKIAEPVTIEVQLPYELEYDSHVPSKFTYDADRRMLTFTLQEGELIGSNRGTLGFAAKVVSTSSQDVQVGVKLLVGDVEKGSDQVAVKVAKPEDPISEEGVVLKGTVTKDNPLSGENFSYVIDYSLSALTGSFTNGELVVQLPAELVFDPPNVQLTSHFTTFEYDKEKHQIVFKLQDDQSAGAVGQLRINNLKFPNYITPESVILL